LLLQRLRNGRLDGVTELSIGSRTVPTGASDSRVALHATFLMLDEPDQAVVTRFERREGFVQRPRVMTPKRELLEQTAPLGFELLSLRPVARLDCGFDTVRQRNDFLEQRCHRFKP
jgi:hypothetical protein